MIGVIPAAGKGRRLGNGPKSLYKYLGKELIKYPLDLMHDIGIKKVVIIHHGEDIKKRIGYRYKDIDIVYIEQKERKGISHAISMSEKVVNNEDLCVILGDIYYDKSIMGMKEKFYEKNHDSIVSVKHVNDKENLIGHAFGISTKGRFIEKPNNVNGLKPFEGCGIYMFKPIVFDLIRKSKINPRTKEFEITDVLNMFDRPGVFEIESSYKNINSSKDLIHDIRIAYIILAHRDPNQIKRLIERLDNYHNLFFIHYDKKSKDEEFDLLKKIFNKKRNVFLLERYNYIWSGFGAVETILNSARHIVDKGIDFDYAVLISGQQYPVKTNEQICSFFNKNYGKIILFHRKVPALPIPPMGCTDWIYRYVFSGKNNKKMFLPYKFPGIFNREFPKNYLPYWGSMWWALPKDALYRIMKKIDDDKELLNYMKHCLGPEELFFTTIIKNDPELKNNIVNMKYIYERWIPIRRGNSSLVDERDFEKLKEPDYLFARRFDNIFCSETLERIDNELLNI